MVVVLFPVRVVPSSLYGYNWIGIRAIIANTIKAVRTKVGQRRGRDCSLLNDEDGEAPIDSGLPDQSNRVC